MNDATLWVGTDAEFLELLTKVIFYTGFHRGIVDRRWSSFQEAFKQFQVDVVARFDEAAVEQLLSKESGIICNAMKVRATIHNANVCCQLREQHGSLAAYWELATNQGETRARALLQKEFKMVGESAAKTLWGMLAVGDSPGFLYS